MILLAIAVISILFDIPIPTFTRDTTTVAGIHPISGFLSNLGILLWCIAGTTCAIVAYILKHLELREKYLFLLSSAFLSAYLMIDDLFQIHEYFSFQIGLSDTITITLLGIAVLIYMVQFRHIIMQTDILLFLLALSLLSSSVFVDTIAEQFLTNQLGDWEYFIEDGIKWIGIVCWCSYYVKTSICFVKDTALLPNTMSQE
ncbi:hypothetical protein CA834_05560 [Winogradskyella aurantia]|uniref:Oxidase n=2 Tax=Winogradskyella aurantia TaxID=1915063 RepID=A0A265UXP5_9FLAO|nr:hypothetical protein CA834_05560 [Winogradskyella aurantia]